MRKITVIAVILLFVGISDANANAIWRPPRMHPTPGGCCLIDAISDSFGIFGNVGLPGRRLHSDFNDASSWGVKAGTRTGDFPYEFVYSDVKLENKDSASPDSHIRCFNVNIAGITHHRSEDSKTIFYPYISFGPGFYAPTDRDDGFGINAGLGFLAKIDKSVFFEASGNYHYLFNGDQDFFEARAGLRFGLLDTPHERLPDPRRMPPPKPVPRPERQER